MTDILFYLMSDEIKVRVKDSSVSYNVPYWDEESGKSFMRDGYVLNFELLKLKIDRVIKTILERQKIDLIRIAFIIPPDMTGVERRALKEFTGASMVYFLDAPLALAFGSGIDVDGPGGKMLVSFGINNTGITLFGLGGIIKYRAIKYGWRHIEDDLVIKLLRKYNLFINHQDASNLLSKYMNSKLKSKKSRFLRVEGRNASTFKEEVIDINISQDISLFLSGAVKRITEEIEIILHQSNIYIIKDIFDFGIYLTGGDWMDKYFDLPHKMIHNPEKNIFSGAFKWLEKKNIPKVSKDLK